MTAETKLAPNIEDAGSREGNTRHPDVLLHELRLRLVRQQMNEPHDRDRANLVAPRLVFAVFLVSHDVFILVGEQNAPSRGLFFLGDDPPRIPRLLIDRVVGA